MTSKISKIMGIKLSTVHAEQNVLTVLAPTPKSSFHDDELARLFQALGHDCRIAIARAVAETPGMTVGDIQGLGEKAKSTMHVHLDKMRSKDEPSKGGYTINPVAIDAMTGFLQSLKTQP